MSLARGLCTCTDIQVSVWVASLPHETLHSNNHRGTQHVSAVCSGSTIPALSNKVCAALRTNAGFLLGETSVVDSYLCCEYGCEYRATARIRNLLWDQVPLQSRFRCCDEPSDQCLLSVRLNSRAWRWAGLRTVRPFNPRPFGSSFSDTHLPVVPGHTANHDGYLICMFSTFPLSPVQVRIQLEIEKKQLFLFFQGAPVSIQTYRVVTSLGNDLYTLLHQQYSTSDSTNCSIEALHPR